MASLLGMAKPKKDAKLEELKLKSGESTQLRLFIDECEEVTLHYGATEQLKGHYHCLGLENRCPACLAGQKATGYYLIPVFVISKDAVGVLKVSENDNHTSLLPQIMDALSKDTAETFQTIRRIDSYNFKVETVKTTNLRLLGTDKISDFLQLLKDGMVDLKSIYRQPTVAELLDIPEIQIALELKKEIEASAT